MIEVSGAVYADSHAVRKTKSQKSQLKALAPLLHLLILLITVRELGKHP